MLGKIVVHGGAGFWQQYMGQGLKGVSKSASVGAEILRRDGSALDAVEAAVCVLEDNPVFNAGKGSAFTVNGTVQMDAGIMDGRDLSAGAVALVQSVKNPVHLARLVMEKTDHVLLAGESAERLGKSFSLPRMDPVTAARRKLFIELKKDTGTKLKWWRNNPKLLREHPEVGCSDTVGALAVDNRGNFAAASSTGGVMLKLPGRIGDTPQIGCGVYADNRSGAATATGWGEIAVRLVLSKATCSLMERGLPAPRAATIGVQDASRRLKGDAGLLAIDRKGRIAAVHNTQTMPWAYSTSKMKKAHASPYGKKIVSY